MDTKKDPYLNFSREQELTDDDRKRIVTLLMSGLESEFWKILESVMDNRIIDAKEMVLDPENNLSPEAREKWVRWHFYLNEMRNLPRDLIESLLPPKNGEKVENLDPFE